MAPGAAPPALNAAWRVTHASPDAPNVNIYVNGNQILSNVPYGVSSGDIAIPAGSFSVEVRGIAVDGSEIPGVIGPATISVIFCRLAIRHCANWNRRI